MPRPCVSKLAASAALVVLSAACAPARPATPSSGVPAIADTIRVRHNGRIEAVRLDEYAAAVALTEIAPGAESPSTAEALYEAQIIVARTYAASRRGRHGAEGFDLCDTTHCQRYEASRLQTARWAQLARAAAARTTREVLVHGGQLVEAVFHADCGGHTANAKDVWGSARPYLIARKDTLKDPHRQWESALSLASVSSALAGDRRTRVELPLRDLKIARRDASGRAARMTIVGRSSVEVDGDVFRAVLTAALGIRALPSTRFTLKRDGSGWRAGGAGFGHGVGMCQAGALSRARHGARAAEILGFYYPAAIIRRAAAR